MTTAKQKEIAMKRFFRKLNAYKAEFEVNVRNEIRTKLGTVDDKAWHCLCPIEAAAETSWATHSEGAFKLGLDQDQHRAIIDAADTEHRFLRNTKQQKLRKRMLDILGLTEVTA